MSTEYEQLKITALEIGEPLKDEKGNILPDTKKILKPGIFNFYKQDSIVPKDFFKFSKPDADSKPKNNLNISISAVVGKNGSGKSTIVEEMLRLINNLGHIVIDKTSSELAFDLEKAGNTINNRLYFSIFNKDGNAEEPEKKYCISQEGRLIDDNTQNKNSEKLIFSKYEKETDKYEEYINLGSLLKGDDRDNRAGRMSSSFFYTIVVNNSAYAFNTRDFEEEWQPNGDRNLHWINGIFHKNDGYQTPIVLNPMRTEGNIDINTETQLAKDRLISLFLNKDIQDVNSQNVFDSLIIARPFKSDTKGKKIEKNEVWKWSKLKCEIYRELKTTIIAEWQKKGYNFKKPHNYDYKLATEYLAYKTLSIVWSYGYGVLKNELVGATANYDDSLHNTFIKKVNLIDENNKNYDQKFAELIKELKPQVEPLVNILNKNKSHITLKIRQTLAFLVLRHYDLKKTPPNKVGHKYVINHGQVGYGGPPRLVIPNNSNEGERLKAEAEFRAEFSAWTDAVSKLDNYHHFTDEEVTIPAEKDDPKNKYSEQRKYIKENDWSPLDLVPAPCFKTEIIIKNKATNEKYKITRLSSGERQQINTISTILYHLRNIDSVKEAPSVIKYKHINLILDEIELYFHPEMQRTFIHELLEAISKLEIKDIKSINIMLLTHSPFILSDIPKANVLFLRDGKHCDDVYPETFGGNISDLFKSSFFMEDGFIGEFASQKIKKFIEEIEPLWRGKKKISEDKYNEYSSFIETIGEPLVRRKLFMMIEDLFYESTTEKLINEREKRYEKEIDLLKKQLNRGKDKICGN